MKRKILSIVLVLSMLCAFIPVVVTADTTITQTSATITKSETGTTYNFDVDPEAACENCYVYAAVYDTNGTLLAVNRAPIVKIGNTNISVDKSEYNALIKVFIWSDDMQPVIETKEFILTPTITPKPITTSSPTPKPSPAVTQSPTSTPKPPSNVTWSFDEATGTLTVSGTGDMEDYKEFSSPFYNNSDIVSIIIEDGVTSISCC